ncbi:MAG: FHA domain-containing protein [Gammaproteobacteria bacterium]|nr:FHA domain-containing protein [Gammaproteobacteria bacterium]
MYYEHFHLKEHPFRLSSDTRFFYEGVEHAHALAMMEYALIEHQGLMLLTGEVGSGKSMLLQHYLARIDKTYPVLRFVDGPVPEGEFLHQLAQYFGMELEGQSRRKLLEGFCAELASYPQKGKKLIIAVDDAHRFEPITLMDLAQIGHSQRGPGGGCTLYLVGSPTLQEVFNLPDIPSPCCRYSLNPLNTADIRSYILHRLSVAGPQHTARLNAEAFTEIELYTGGSPRQINILVDHLLTNAYLADVSEVTNKIVEASVNELQWVPHGLTPSVQVETEDTDSAFLTDRRESYLIVISKNKQIKSEFTLHKKRINIGRHRSNDVSIDDPLISRVHAQIYRQGRIYYIRDMHSKNGIFINNKRIDIAPLKEHTEVKLGDCILTFVRQTKGVNSAA